MDNWVKSHVVDVPQITQAFCGDVLHGVKVLNVGCGEMLTDLGLLNLGPTSIMGLDIWNMPEGWFNNIAERVRNEGHSFPADYIDRLAYTAYNGTVFPFDDNSFDVVFSWSAFEHIADIDAVLREMHRVVTPEGLVFVQVWPWFPSRRGSHLEAWISQPFFHLRQRDEWVKAQLKKFIAANPGADANFIENYMFDEYLKMNRISSSTFYEAARDAGFIVKKARIEAFDEDLSNAPRGVSFSDLMITATTMLMQKGVTVTSVHRSRQV